ncbi:unnamed protein product [Lampetra planeri]
MPSTAREAAGSCRRTTVPHAGSSPDTPPTGARTGAAAVPARPKLKATLVLSRGRGGERVAPPRRYEVAIPTLPRGQIPPPDISELVEAPTLYPTTTRDRADRLAAANPFAPLAAE